MHRLVLAALAVVAAGGAFWLRQQSSVSSFAAYSDSQLDTLEAGYRRVMQTPTAPTSGGAARPDAALDAELSLQMLQNERHRRTTLRGLAIVALFGTLGALLMGRRSGRADRGEDTRLREAMGDPAVLLEGERHKAARLLGVTPDAPPEVIDAALAARLAASDLDRLEGIAPEVRRLVLDRRQELQRARDLLLRNPASDPATAPQQ